MEDYTKYKPDSFEYDGKWVKNWFSNTTQCIFEYDGIEFNSVENFYQSMKTLDINERMYMSKLDPLVCKKYGSKVKLRDDWNSIKVDVMNLGLTRKFSIKEHRDMLMSTDGMIIEWNNWGDKFWGVTINDCLGNNELGKLLISLRNSIKLGII
jgi:ribA/ribD-fused uncharacterized protein